MKTETVQILLADDDSTSAGLIRRVLRDIGFSHIQTVGDGYVALMTIKKTPISLLIVDWNLPKLDGFRLIEEIRKIPRFRAPRIIMMTSQVTRQSLEIAVDLGIDEYLLKPFTAKVLKEKIETVLDVKI